MTSGSGNNRVSPQIAGQRKFPECVTAFPCLAFANKRQCDIHVLTEEGAHIGGHER
jgi:hypothetical protein